MNPFVMSVNNGGCGHGPYWWTDEHATLNAIYFDGDEHSHVATLGAPFVLYIVRADNRESAIGGAGRVTGAPVRNAPGRWDTKVPCVLEMIGPADALAPSLSERGISGSACRPSRRLDADDFQHFVLSLAMSNNKRALALASAR